MYQTVLSLRTVKSLIFGFFAVCAGGGGGVKLTLSSLTTIKMHKEWVIAVNLEEKIV
jgi:hypothetical protein